MYQIIPFSKRKIDWALVGFFFVNLLFVTYMIDFEQIVIRDPNNFQYPIWPPKIAIDLVHWWGNRFDPVLMARPAWWMATIWWDSLLFGPYYAFAIYAFIKGREWIRIPTIIYSSIMLSGVTVILTEEAFGIHATPNLPIVLLANASWVIVPVYLLFRMSFDPHPFSKLRS